MGDTLTLRPTGLTLTLKQRPIPALTVRHGSAAALTLATPAYGNALTLRAANRALLTVAERVFINSVFDGANPKVTHNSNIFLPAADLVDDTSTSIYFYFGWLNPSNGELWLVRRVDRENLTKINATIENNPQYTSLADAWPYRETLNFI